MHALFQHFAFSVAMHHSLYVKVSDSVRSHHAHARRISDFHAKFLFNQLIDRGHT
ncbi:MAG: hypothetical protein HC935_04410 [Pseudanabaena sp. SU_2_4]|nr:hypothetical protein [Pseudanabaena sp. SU_2_4]